MEIEICYVFEDAETFKIDQNNFLLEIGKKTKNLDDINGQFMGLIKFTPDGWKKFKNSFHLCQIKYLKKFK